MRPPPLRARFFRRSVAASAVESRSWWTQLLGREPDAVPMPGDIEWHAPGGGGIQLVDDADDAELDALRARGLDVPEAETVPSGQFRIAMLEDPDGDTVVLAQALTG